MLGLFASGAVPAALADDGICNLDPPPVLSVFDELRTIALGDKEVVLRFDNTGDHGERVVHMNATHPASIQPSLLGHSIGKWEGNTLVVTTLDQNEKTWLDRAGNFHSDDLKVTERFTLIDKDHIRYEATMEDPNVYSRPWTIEMPLYRVIEDNAQVMEHKCVPFADKLLYSDLLHLQPPPKNPGAKK